MEQIDLAPFFLAAFEVTQSQWQGLQGENVAYWAPEFSPSDRVPLDLTHPVENISWLDCERVLARAGLILPTECQWEYACRAGRETSWSWGHSKQGIERFANVKDRSFARQPMASGVVEEVETGYPYHAPVGSFLPNDFGLFDMHGNVWEWCRDPFVETYDLAPPRAGDGLRQAESRHRVTRGGSFWELAEQLRSAHRDCDPPDRKAYHLGVRAARELEGA